MRSCFLAFTPLVAALTYAAPAYHVYLQTTWLVTADLLDSAPSETPLSVTTEGVARTHAPALQTIETAVISTPRPQIPETPSTGTPLSQEARNGKPVSALSIILVSRGADMSSQTSSATMASTSSAETSVVAKLKGYSATTLPISGLESRDILSAETLPSAMPSSPTVSTPVSFPMLVTSHICSH